MKQIAIQKLFSFFFTTSDQIESDVCGEKVDIFIDELRSLCEKHEITLSEGYTSFYGLEKYSIQNCENCKKVMINRDKNPMGFGETELSKELDWVVSNGGESGGKVLCEECLPPNHRWRA